jgi:flagellar basal body rod protein FlgG
VNYGLYVAASGVSASLARQDVFSNNLANVSTTGFKPLEIAVREREVVRLEDDLGLVDSDRLLERLGAGVMPTPTSVKLSHGAHEQTGRSLDVAIEGDGFLVARAGPGDEGLRLTRDGRLAIGRGGRLELASDGSPVLGPEGGEIRLDPMAPTHFRADGAIEQHGATVGRLWVADVTDRAALVPRGGGTLGLADGTPGARLIRGGTGRVTQGHLERSAVDPLKTIMDVTNAGRSARGNLRMISVFGETMDTAINRFGRVG